jgi:Short C-terminal domain
MRGRRGRPGLAGTMARTAVIAGTATAVSGSVRNKQAAAAPPSAEDQAAAAQQAADAQAYHQQQAAATPPAAPAAPAPSAGDDIITQLERLGALHSQGVLTDDEFGAAKAKLLG